jgi:hypothetical protein
LVVLFELVWRGGVTLEVLSRGVVTGAELQTAEFDSERRRRRRRFENSQTSVL